MFDTDDFGEYESESLSNCEYDEETDLIDAYDTDVDT